MIRSLNWMVLLASILLICIPGCTPRTFVKKSPGPKDCGIRYYRPKPYLMVKPAITKSGEPVAGYVSIEPTTLPDFSEEYSIHIRSGLGTNDTSITLDDGWNLTALNVNLDSQFDDNVSAIADIVDAVPTRGFEGAGRVEIKGINVPFGLYEAVISRDGCTKRLYGFRYVGFIPFSTCPVEISGCHGGPCETAPIYGLVFDQAENVMVFKPLHEIPEMRAKREVIDGELPVLDDPNEDTVDNLVLPDNTPTTHAHHQPTR